MGHRHRQIRKTQKGVLQLVRERTRFDHINENLSLNQYRRLVRDPGYRETELGELRSTIRNLTEEEIIDRMSAKAIHEIHQQEDRRVFADIARALLAAPF